MQQKGVPLQSLGGAMLNHRPRARKLFKDPRMSRLDEPDEPDGNEHEENEPATPVTMPASAAQSPRLTISDPAKFTGDADGSGLPVSPMDVTAALPDEDDLPVTSIPVRGSFASVQRHVATAVNAILSERAIEEGQVVAFALTKLNAAEMAERATLELMVVERESRESIERWDLHIQIINGLTPARGATRQIQKEVAYEEFVAAVIEKQVRRSCKFLPTCFAPLDVELQVRLREHAHSTLDESPVKEYERLHTRLAVPDMTPDAMTAAQGNRTFMMALWAALAAVAFAVGVGAGLTAAFSRYVRSALWFTVPF